MVPPHTVTVLKPSLNILWIHNKFQAFSLRSVNIKAPEFQASDLHRVKLLLESSVIVPEKQNWIQGNGKAPKTQLQKQRLKNFLTHVLFTYTAVNVNEELPDCTFFPPSPFQREKESCLYTSNYCGGKTGRWWLWPLWSPSYHFESIYPFTLANVNRVICLFVNF